MAHVDTIVFDKTGTLTQGKPVLASWSGTDEQLRLAAALRTAGPVQPGQLARQARATRVQELKIVRAADVTLVVSPVEQGLLRLECPGSRIEILSNVHEVVGSRRPFAERRDIQFTGGFGHPPNVDAVQWFVDEIWPDVRGGIVPADLFDEVQKILGHSSASVTERYSHLSPKALLDASSAAAVMIQGAQQGAAGGEAAAV